ncbi:MAG: hypothetical protein F4110_13465 [Acidimicrobiaceae bacterium]|nr:hypothetical protein [Acidimicrobiaceae bacterium]MYD01816.1 hypothetical protein [Gammaproteobacteria bacterium]MYI54966.1 hypothetical protein [Acidimicrobiaceae bacterium]
MKAPDMNKRTLNRLPHAVQAIMNEVGLRATLEDLFDNLRGDNIPSDECPDLLELLDWTIGVLMAATGPLVHQTFNSLNSNFSRIGRYIANNDWHSYTGHIPQILQDLATIPTTHPGYSLEATKNVTAALQKARRSIVASEASVRKKQEEAENFFTESVESHEEALTSEAKAVSTRFRRLKSTATGRLANLKAKSAEEHESLSLRMTELFDNLKHTATDEHANLLRQMTELLEDLQERYGFTATQVLGGNHEGAANAERRMAESHSKRSRWSMWGALVWAALAQAALILGWSPDWDQWFDAARTVPIVGSPVVILLFIAKREGRVASEHRARHERLQSLALQFKSWEPYLSTLTPEARASLEAEVTPKLFPGDDGASMPSEA